MTTGRDRVDKGLAFDPLLASGATVISTSFFNSSFLVSIQQPLRSNGRRRFHGQETARRCARSRCFVVTNRLCADFQRVLCFYFHVSDKRNNFGPRIVDGLLPESDRVCRQRRINRKVNLLELMVVVHKSNVAAARNHRYKRPSFINFCS